MLVERLRSDNATGSAPSGRRLHDNQEQPRSQSGLSDDMPQPSPASPINAAIIAFALSLFAGLVAGIYPSWRICRVAPATYLKLQ